MFDGQDAFVSGANLPWITYGGDFGANAWWPTGGLKARGVPDDLRRTLDDLRAGGVRLLRWFLFCDGRAGIRFDIHGDPLGLDPCVLPDFDVALDLARAADMQLMPALFDFHWLGRAQVVNAVQIRGRRRVIARSAARAALGERVLLPLFAHCGTHPAIAAWDVINEPEWSTFGVGTFDPRRAVWRSTMRAFIRDVTVLAHAQSTHPVTVGSANAGWLDLVTGLGLDFYQVHWYDHMERRSPLSRPTRKFGLDRSVVLGEFPTRGSAHDLSAMMEIARRAGYTGALFWSVMAEDHATDCTAAVAGIARWNAGAERTVRASAGEKAADAHTRHG